MKLYKLSDEEYKMLMEIDKRNNYIKLKDNIIKEGGVRYYKMDGQTVGDVYDGAEIAAKKIAREYEDKWKSLFKRMVYIN